MDPFDAVKSSHSLSLHVAGPALKPNRLHVIFHPPQLQESPNTRLTASNCHHNNVFPPCALSLPVVHSSLE